MVRRTTYYTAFPRGIATSSYPKRYKDIIQIIFSLFDQMGLKVDVEVRAKAARDQMGVLKDIHKALGGSTAAGKKKTMTDAEKLELEGTEKLVSEAKAEFLPEDP